MKNGEKIIVIDFDGTIAPNNFPEFSEPYKGTKKALEELKRLGFKIVIHTSRTAGYWFREKNKIPRLDKQLELLKEYFNKYELPYDYFWLADKPIATYYIDDRALTLKNGNWQKVIKKIKKDINNE